MSLYDERIVILFSLIRLTLTMICISYEVLYQRWSSKTQGQTEQ